MALGVWTLIANSGNDTKLSGTGLYARQDTASGPVIVRNHNSTKVELEAQWRLHPYWTGISTALGIV